jgi:hypothetical protein
MDRSHTITQADGAVEVEYLDVTWNAVRRERDAALAESDWRALKDVVLSTAWKEYRQALRDLGGFPSSNEAADNWPVLPDE